MVHDVEAAIVTALYREAVSAFPGAVVLSLFTQVGSVGATSRLGENTDKRYR
jgi:hypothetical protein